MQAEDLADGKHQKGFVSDVAQQFGELMYYVEQLEKQRDNLKKAYTRLLNSKVSCETVEENFNQNDPYSCREYW